MCCSFTCSQKGVHEGRREKGKQRAAIFVLSQHLLIPPESVRLLLLLLLFLLLLLLLLLLFFFFFFFFFLLSSSFFLFPFSFSLFPFPFSLFLLLIFCLQIRYAETLVNVDKMEKLGVAEPFYVAWFADLRCECLAKLSRTKLALEVRRQVPWSREKEDVGRA